MSDEQSRDTAEGRILPADADPKEAHRVVPHDEDSVPGDAAPVGSLPTEDDDDENLPEDDDEVDDDEVDDDDSPG